MDEFTREELMDYVTNWMNGWVYSECMYDDEEDRLRQARALSAVLDILDKAYERR